MNTAHKIVLGLTQHPKTLSHLQWLHYDHEGSLIFEEILLQDEYYVARTERSIFELNLDEIIAKVSGKTSNRIRIVELGAGTATKTSILLAAGVKHQGPSIDYMPVDISLTVLSECQSTL